MIEDYKVRFDDITFDCVDQALRKMSRWMS